MNEEFEILKLVTERLNNADIKYMISGSTAVNYYSVPRMTRDIDIVVELNKPDIVTFIKLFQEDFYLDKEAIEEEIQRRGMFNIVHINFFVKIDFIIRKETEFKKTEFLRKREISIENSPMWIVTPEDLIIAKLDWAKESYSEMQLKDVQNIITSKNDLDWNYIQNWINLLNLNTIFEKLEYEK